MCYCILNFELYMQYHKVERGIIPMKNSDMKVIAIILSIALFFTIVTSNAVSIASVVFLAKDAATTQEGTVDASGDNTVTPDASTATTPSGSTATTPDAGTATTPDAGTATTPSGSTATTPSGSTATTPSGSTATTPDANKPADNAGETADNNAIMKDPLAAYQKAAMDIHKNGSASYNKIGWQTPLKIEGLGILDGVIVPILESFMTTEDEAEVKVNTKGSDDAKNRMPISNCSKGSVKSATAEKLSNGNYKVVIVMNEQTNPSYADKDGLAVMSREFLDYKDVEKEAANISVVKSLEGEIKYVDYTITAEMTADGKFVSITHYGIGYIKANLNGSINASGELEFNAKYTDFKY